MISQHALDIAVEQGLLTRAQTRGLAEIEAGLAIRRPEAEDPEKLRFITGFGDIFVTIGLLLFLGAIFYFGGTYGGHPAGPLAVAGAGWLLAEFFTRKRRMALPSIVLLLAFTTGMFLASLFLFGDGAPLRDPPGAAPLMIAGAVTALAAVLHYWRFRVPVTVAAGAAALVAILAGILLAFGREVYFAAVDPLMLVCGVLIFAAAMWFDARDPTRETRRTDIAFWLHLLAAPMIVHPLISTLWTEGTLSSGAAAGILAIFLGLGAVAVLVNRRAILVSGLSYAGYAFGQLINQAGFADSAVPLTLLALGAFVLLLSAGWARVRTAILSIVPARWRTALPPDLAAPR